MKIFFALSMYRNIAHPECVKSLERTLRLLEERGHASVIGICAGSCYIQVARNRLVRDFMQSGADVLFFIDDDVSWEAKDAVTMAESSDMIVAGIYPLKKPFEDYPVVIQVDGNQRAVVRKDGAIAAFGVPAGMLSIKREVIEKLIAAHPERRYYDVIDGEKIDGFYDLFPQGVYGERWVGEDFAFCQLWRDLGGEMWVFPNMTMGHHMGDKSWFGNYHEFLLRQPGGSKAA